MAKIKHTKNELKAQRDALQRFERFLPMLQLKKQQLQSEIQTIDNQLAETDGKIDAINKQLEPWVSLFGSDPGVDKLVQLTGVETEEGNIAGVAIPVLKKLDIHRVDYQLFSTPSWFDDAAEVITSLIGLRIEHEIIEEQRRLVHEELRVTSQRVNLFEKVKIPECKENIRIIKIFLGDEQTAGVARAKIAKGRTDVPERREEAA